MKMLYKFVGEYFLDSSFGIKALGKFVHDTELVEKGIAKLSDFGYSEKRGLKPQGFEFNNPNVVSGGAGKDILNIVEIDIVGVMTLEGGLSSRGTRDIANDLRGLNEIDGVLININSGGGESMSSGVLINALKDLGVPVVAYGDFIGSAAYDVAKEANEIILSSNIAMAGSIGSYMVVDKVLIERIKEEYMYIYGDGSEDKNKEFRDLLEGDDSSARARTTHFAEIFRNDVIKARALKRRSSDIEKAIRGGMFFADEAKSLGLVDGVGTKDYAIKRLIFHINNK